VSIKGKVVSNPGIPGLISRASCELFSERTKNAIQEGATFALQKKNKK
jgi:hypothetical protein